LHNTIQIEIIKAYAERWHAKCEKMKKEGRPVDLEEKSALPKTYCR